MTENENSVKKYAGHTPRPWAIPDLGKRPIIVSAAPIRGGGWRGMIASVDAGDYSASEKEGIANANLIADAPALLAQRDALLALARHIHLGVPEADELERAGMVDYPHKKLLRALQRRAEAILKELEPLDAIAQARATQSEAGGEGES